MERPLTTHQAARLAGVSPSAVLNWIDRGLLLATRTPGGHRRIERAEFLRFLSTYGMSTRSAPSRVDRLLVIDDEPIFTRSVKRAVEQLAPCVEVETANTPIDGLLRVSTFQPNAVILDTYMEGLDGIEICRQLKAAPATRHIAVIATSGTPSDELAGRYREAGALAFVEKPLNIPTVLKLLNL